MDKLCKLLSKEGRVSLFDVADFVVFPCAREECDEHAFSFKGRGGLQWLGQIEGSMLFLCIINCRICASAAECKKKQCGKQYGKNFFHGYSPSLCVQKRARVHYS